MLKPLMNLIKALSSNTDPGALAHAFSCGILLGFLPKDNMLWYVLFIFIFFMRIQRSVFSLVTVAASLLAALLDPVFDSVGYWILTLGGAQNFYAALLEIPFVAFTKFNNTVVMGALVVGLASYIPFYIIARVFIFVWRKYLAESVRKLKLVKMLKQIPLITKIAEMAGK